MPRQPYARAMPVTTRRNRSRALRVRGTGCAPSRAQGPRTLTASIWSASGDAGITPGSAEGLALRDLADLLESYVGDVLEYLEANSTS
jgi:hypothetical protein